MLARTSGGVGAALDSDDARLGLLQPAPASKTSRVAKPIERSPAMFIRPFSRQALIRCASVVPRLSRRVFRIGSSIPAMLSGQGAGFPVRCGTSLGHVATEGHASRKKQAQSTRPHTFALLGNDFKHRR